VPEEEGCVCVCVCEVRIFRQWKKFRCVLIMCQVLRCREILCYKERLYQVKHYKGGHHVIISLLLMSCQRYISILICSKHSDRNMILGVQNFRVVFTVINLNFAVHNDVVQEVKSILFSQNVAEFYCPCWF
jgi:hypothetical protein